MPDLLARSSTPHPNHFLDAFTVNQVAIYSASHHLFTPVSGPKVILDDSSNDYVLQSDLGCDTFKYCTMISQL